MPCETNEIKSVSVIIPCYNCRRYIEQTLESLEQQTCKDFQVICVNDGSTDDTPRILKRWQEKGSLDMTVIHQENGGVSTARNAGIEAAQSEFILFLDSDDLYHPCYIEAMLTAVRESGADTVYSPLIRALEKMRGGQVEPNRFEWAVTVFTVICTAAVYSWSMGYVLRWECAILRTGNLTGNTFASAKMPHGLMCRCMATAVRRDRSCRVR